MGRDKSLAPTQYGLSLCVWRAGVCVCVCVCVGVFAGDVDK